MRASLLPALYTIVALAIIQPGFAESESEYVGRRDAEAKELHEHCSDAPDEMLCLTEVGFSCEPRDGEGADAWYCSKELERGKFEAIVVHDEPDRRFRIRWRIAD